jgi:D-3-phosphoglycerate dehydrogenase
VSRIEGVPNLIVTPHLAYYSEQSLAELQRKATTQVVKVLSGAEPDYRVG